MAGRLRDCAAIKCVWSRREARILAEALKSRPLFGVIVAANVEMLIRVPEARFGLERPSLTEYVRHGLRNSE